GKTSLIMRQVSRGTKRAVDRAVIRQRVSTHRLNLIRIYEEEDGYELILPGCSPLSRLKLLLAVQPLQIVCYKTLKVRFSSLACFLSIIHRMQKGHGIYELILTWSQRENEIINVVSKFSAGLTVETLTLNP
ncbi:hypothetical protein PFISCL1PPCAC_229, partial [Pristionchus fissidentatus]